MAHNIDMSNGRANAAFARTPAWHKLGTVIDRAMSGEEAIELGGLNWNAELRRMWREDRNGQPVEDTRKRAVVRSDTDKVLGIVGQTYVPAQNRELVSLLEAIVGAGCKFDSAGSLYGGQKVWINCKATDCFEVLPDDLVETYLAILNGHDGTTRLTAVATATRVVCANTFNLVMNGVERGGGRSITIRHDGRLEDNIQRAKEALGLVHTTAERMKQEAEALVKVQMKQDAMAKFFAEQVQKLGQSEEAAKITLLQLSRLAHSPTNTVKGMEGTAWQAYNVWSEFVDHAPRRIAADKRLESVWIGEGAQQKASAWTQLLTMAN